MSELRNRTFPPPPPPRHPAARPPSPNSHVRPSNLNAPPPVHPPPPSLPPRPPPSPRPDSRSEYFSREPIPSQGSSPSDVPHTSVIQGPSPPVPPNRPSNPLSSSENIVRSTSSVDVEPVGATIPPPKHPSELPPPVSPSSSFNSITGSPAIAPPPPPVHHARKERSLTADSAHEDSLSEKELRDLYNDEEIDRFLRLFSAVGRPSLCC